MKKLTFVFICLLLAVPCVAGTITVDNNGPADFNNIQAAIDVATTGDTVIVSPSTYTGPGNRDISFLGKAITVKSTKPQDPCIVATTIIDCNGSPNEPHRGFIFYNNEDANSVLEGFTITNGYADAGGAICCNASSPAVKNCIFSKNVSKWDGGGIYDYNSSPEVTNCTFTGNSAGQYGGGMFNRYSSPTLNNCIFNNNSAAFISGGGIYNYYSSLEVTNCTFTENSAYSDPAYPSFSFGGGICNRYGSSTIANCTFTGNSAGRGGGMYNYGNSLTITNCTFTDNQAAIGGGISNGSNSSSTVTNCIFIGNSVTDTGGGMSSYLDSNSIVNNCTFTDNSSDGWGGGMHNADGNYMVNNCTFNGNSAGYDGGGLNDTNSVTVVQNCLFIRNSAGDDGGGMHTYLDSNSIVNNCTFSGNSASDWGGAMMVDESTATATNCIFINNSADDGGAILNYAVSYNDRPVSKLLNCTLVGNSASSNGGAIANLYYSSPAVTNCIIWDNIAIEYPATNNIFNWYESGIILTYSDIQPGWPGTGNIDADPCFIEPGYWADANDANIIVEPNDPNAVWLDGDYHLLPTSPCIDAANDANVYTDIEGNIRPFDFPGVDNNGELPEFDMGAYELTPIEAQMKFTPPNLNCKSKGKFVKAHIALPEGFTPEDVALDTPALAYPMNLESEYLEVFLNDYGSVELKITFDRQAFCDSLTETGQSEVTVIGSLTTGRYFYGTDTITVKPQR